MGLVYTQQCEEKCLVRIEESVLLQVVVQAHSPVCGTLELHKKSSQYFSLVW